jgi:hypothetical protein
MYFQRWQVLALVIAGLLISLSFLWPVRGIGFLL